MQVRDGCGYWLVLCKGHHRDSKQNSYVRENILVFERTHNCCVLGYELACIHHIKGNKGDNRSENLAGMSPRQHRRLHMIGNIYAKGNKLSKKTKQNMSLSRMGHLLLQKKPGER